MPNGDPIDSGRVAGDLYYRSLILLDAAVATTSGVWIDVRSFPRLTVDIFGTFVGTVQLMGSNEATIPSNATDGRQLGSNITLPSIIALDSPVRWLKAKISSYGSGTINANIMMVSM